jgi:hypothetical protein
VLDQLAPRRRRRQLEVCHLEQAGQAVADRVVQPPLAARGPLGEREVRRWERLEALNGRFRLRRAADHGAKDGRSTISGGPVGSKLSANAMQARAGIVASALANGINGLSSIGSSSGMMRVGASDGGVPADRRRSPSYRPRHPLDLARYTGDEAISVRPRKVADSQQA